MNTVGLKTEKVFYEFEGFRVDPVRRRIVRAGEPVPLTPKAFSILLVLLERRGEVVEKEELIQRVWPDTYVTEANLTQNISSLRKALGERAQDSRFVVTVPGQGYSFVADVLEVPRDSTAEIPLSSLVPPAAQPAPAEPTPAPAAHAPLPPSPEPALPAAAPEAAPASVPPAATPAPALAVIPAVQDMPAMPVMPAMPAAPAELVPVEPRALSLPTGVAPGLSEAARREVLAAQMDATGSYPVRRRRGLYMTGVVLLVLAVLTIPLVLLKVRARPASPVTFMSDRRSIAVLPLRNLTGNPNDAWLATALAEMMTTELEADANLRVVSGGNVARVQQVVTIAGPAADGEAPSTLKKIHSLLGADLVVSGSYSILPDSQGGQIRLDLRVLDTVSGDTVAAFPELGNQRQVFDLVSRAGAKLRSSLGWSNLSPEQAKAVQAQRLTSTEAARLYAEGLERLRAFDPLAARDLLQKAAEADPNSPTIHSALSEAWTKLGYDAKAAEEALRARELAASLTRPQRLPIEARYHETRREWNQAADIYRSLWTFFPDDLDHGLNLARTLSTAGRSAESRTVIDELRRLPEPEGLDPRIDLAEAEVAMRMSDHAAQLEAAERAIEKGNELDETQIVAEALTSKGDALLLSGNPKESVIHYERARDLYEQAGNKPAAESLLLNLGVAYQQMSKLAEARRMIETALASAQGQGSSRNISLLQANLAVLHMDLGDVRGARELIEQAYAAFKTEGDRVREEKALYILSTALMAQGDIAGAQQRLQTVQSLAQQTGNRTDLVVTLDDLGVLLARKNSPAQAMRLHSQALAISRSLKDQGRVARVLISTGDTLTQMGALARAEQSYAEAFDHARAMGHRLLIARTYGGLSRLAYVKGDLKEARGHAQNELRIAQDAGAQPIVVRARADLAQIDLAAGDLDGARQHLDDALKVASSLGLELDKMGLRLRLSRVALAEGDPQAATALAQEAAEWFGKRKLIAEQSRALAVLTEALVSGKRLAEAQEVSSQLRALAGTSDDLELRVSAILQAARVGSTAGEVGESFMKMRQAEELARNSGLVAAGLEARLVLGQFQLERLDRVAGRAALESLRREAQAKGFWRVAEHAAEALEVRRAAGSPGSPVAGP